MTTKPKLTVLSKKNLMDAEALAKLFEKLTGRKPTKDEITAAKAELQRVNLQ